jgi:hypothetical protein
VEDFGWEVGQRAVGLWVDGAGCVDLGGLLELWEWERCWRDEEHTSFRISPGLAVARGPR